MQHGVKQPEPQPPRAAGVPKQTFWKLLRYGLDAIFSFSYKPLRLSLFFGLFTSAFAMLYGTMLVVCRVLGVGMFGIPVVDGYSSTIVSILFLGGVQLICVGILGEYVGRIYEEVKQRPLYVVKERVGIGLNGVRPGESPEGRGKRLEAGASIPPP